MRRPLRRRPTATVPALSVSASGERARPAAACSGIRLRVSGRRGSPSPPGGGRGLVSRSLLRRRSPASAPGDARTLRRGLGPQFPDEASLWLVPSTPVARVFLWIGATEGRPELTGLVITASFSGIAGASLRLVLGSPPSVPAWFWWASGDRPRHPSALARRWWGLEPSGRRRLWRCRLNSGRPAGCGWARRGPSGRGAPSPLSQFEDRVGSSFSLTGSLG